MGPLVDASKRENMRFSIVEQVTGEKNRRKLLQALGSLPLVGR
jgi:hypothetical protein